MAKQFRPLPPNYRLDTSLARRVQQLREFRHLTIEDIADMTRFPVKRVEEIEAGFETWFSATERQLLAKALGVEPILIQEVEAKPPAKQGLTISQNTKITQAILFGQRDLECPDCGSTLRCSVVDALDIDGQPTRFAKAFCNKCPFILR